MIARTRHEPVRGFALEVLPEEGDAYGVVLRETSENGSSVPHLALHAGATHVRRILPSVLTAIKASGHPKTALSAQRRKPVTVNEEPAVRLALVLLATRPIKKLSRLDAMARTIEGLSAEETYYWYAKCVGPDAARMRRALRLFLASE